MTMLRIFLDAAHDGVYNMAYDESLLEEAITGDRFDPTIRFYRFSEEICTVGYGMWRRLSTDFLKGRRAIRRVTGGGVVVHSNDLIYSLVVALNTYGMFRQVRESYWEIHSALRASLAVFGIKTDVFTGSCAVHKPNYCFETPVLYDLMWEGRKIAGAGQKRSRGILLHQGSIAWDVLGEASTHLAEAEFSSAFANSLADRMGIQACQIAGPADLSAYASARAGIMMRETKVHGYTGAGIR